MNTVSKPVPLSYSVGLTLLSGLPLFTLTPVGLDIFLPSVPEIGAFFGSNDVPALAISIYMLFLGLGQLFWGSMADTVGKKNVALIGLVIFALSSLLITFVKSDESVEFLTYRALQSFGGSAGFTAMFAIIRNRFEGNKLNQAYSYLNGVLAVVPVSAPLLGAYIVENNVWFTLFTLMAWLGGIGFIWVMLFLANDKKQQGSDDVKPVTQSLAARYKSVVMNNRFKTYLFFALVSQSLFIYVLTVAPMYLMERLGVSQVTFGQLFMIIAGVFMVGSFLAPKVSAVMSSRALLGMSYSLILAGGLLMFAMSSILTWYSLILPLVFVATGATFVMGCSPALAMADFKDNAGVASGLYTATLFGIGALLSAVYTQVAGSIDLVNIATVYSVVSVAGLALLTVNKTVKKDSA